MNRSVVELVCTECDKTVTDDPALPIGSFDDNRFVSAWTWRPEPEHQPDVFVCGACAADIVRLHFAQTGEHRHASVAGLVCVECDKTVTNDPALPISSFQESRFPVGHELDVVMCGTCALRVVRCISRGRTDGGASWRSLTQPKHPPHPRVRAAVRC